MRPIRGQRQRILRLEAAWPQPSPIGRHGAAGSYPKPIHRVTRDLWQPAHACGSAHGGLVAPNVLDQDFAAERPDQKWGADISYIWTAEGWLYLAIVVDLFSRRIVGWATSDRMKKDLALTALNRAVAVRRPAPGIIHHSDRGSQYCSDAYRKLLADHKIVASMSGKGNCYDNAMVETVFKTIKSELIWRTIWQSRL